MARWRRNEAGTRFRVYAQVKTLAPFAEPVPITLSLAAGDVKAGPRDPAIRTMDFRAKQPYHDEKTQVLREGFELPPAQTPLDPVRPGPGGHFDHLEPGTREFRAAHVYAVVRAVLDVWEQYLDRPIEWHFKKATRRLYLFPHVASGNAWSGPGFLEFGWGRRRRRRGRIVAEAPFAENFDMIAHETGHLIMKSVVGNPPPHEKSTMYRAHEEAAADMIACVAALCLDRVLDAVLEETQGNLLTVNTLSRFAAWGPPASTAVEDEQPPSDSVDAFFGAADEDEPREVRRFVHGLTIAKVTEAPDVNKHELSQPASAAAYEVLARMFEQRLVAGGLIPEPLAAVAGRPRISRAARRSFARHFDAKPFRTALEAARDDFGTLLARTWTLSAPFGSGVGFQVAAANMLAADAELFRSAHADIIRTAYERRGIVPARPV